MGVQVSSYEFHTNKVQQPITIVALSDTHNNYFEEWIRIIRSLKPHYIFIIGDLVLDRMLDGTKTSINWRESNSNSYELINSLLDIEPVCMSLWNHEIYMISTDQLDIQSLGVKILDNEYANLPGGHSS